MIFIFYHYKQIKKKEIKTYAFSSIPSPQQLNAQSPVGQDSRPFTALSSHLHTLQVYVFPSSTFMVLPPKVLNTYFYLLS